MDEPGGREVEIPLNDGSRLRVGAREVRIGERVLLLSALEDARLTAVQPETITLRMRDADAVEARPARPGDGAIALEAIYRVRADLRPAAPFAPPASPPGYPPLSYPAPNFAFPGYGAPPPPAGAYPPPPFPPPGYPFAPYPGTIGYVPNPNVGRGELTPVPRTFDQTIAAVFRLYGAHWRRWLALGVLVSLVPALLGGAAQLTVYRMFGITSGRLTISSGFGVDSGPPARTLQLPDHQHLLADVALLFATGILVLIFSSWQTASLALGARDALLGRRVMPARAIRAGLTRLGATLGANILLFLILLAVLAPMLVCLGVVLATLPHLSFHQGAPPTFSGPFATITLFGLLSVLVGIPGAILATLFGVRLGLAPYIAATEEIGGGAALAKSWRLTRGHFWRSFGVYFVAGLVTGALATVTTTIAQSFSLTLDLLVVTPLVAITTAPFSALAATTLLHDLRLRLEGFAAVSDGIEGERP